MSCVYDWFTSDRNLLLLLVFKHSKFLLDEICDVIFSKKVTRLDKKKETVAGLKSVNAFLDLFKCECHGEKKHRDEMISVLCDAVIENGDWTSNALVREDEYINWMTDPSFNAFT